MVLCKIGFMTHHDHELAIRTITEDGELVAHETDFDFNSAYYFFDEVLNQSKAGEIVQLINEADNIVLAEDRKD